ncbi:RNA polymerase sigma-70 factor, ECF subfamily [Halopseudomonas litoralis]|uniref:RNA polymerase sigma-70 factor, ECF subfamily n=1 Tax=Halopseudomonas litoralis TaxID=797277 RepID=A0A1H1Q6A8_9GAMM|nr:sigma-70 family RNA polymerase sigma factor [Halopseudomonas litoralis]SDS19032.1 RNA polymerase sigma-70 factor, ECF subfamily [Halopseudomonas litoralis]
MADNPIKMAYLNHYAELRNRLKMRLGSYSQADDILHDTWIQLHQKRSQAETKSPLAYLHRMAMNISVNDFRRQEFFEVDTEALLHIADDTLGPEDHTLVTDDIRQLHKALSHLSPRRRDILLASRIYEVPHKELAERYDISTRMIEKELRSALEFCCKHLGREFIQRFGPASDKKT